MTENAYRTGFQAMQEAMNKGSGSKKNNNIFWKNDEEKIIRLLSDDIYTVPFHEFIPCNDGKTRDFVCSEALADPRPCIICSSVMVTKYGSKELTPARDAKSDRTVGLAIVREEKPNGDIVDAKDEEGNVIIGVIKQGQRNFWNNIPYSRNRTTIDRDYAVERKGKGKDTTYVFTGLDVDPDRGVAKNAEASAKLLAEVYKDVLESHPTLVEYIEKLGSKERYDYFLGDKPEEPAVESEGDAPSWATGEDESPAPVKPEEGGLGLKLMGHRKTS